MDHASGAVGAVSYLHLKSDQDFPTAPVGEPFKAVLVIEREVGRAWQARLSDWLVQSGCLYMMAWGRECDSWDDSVDWASLARFDSGEVPDDAHVMTTWHEDESLADTFRFAGWCATHASTALARTLIIDISKDERGPDLLALYETAQKD